MTNNIISSDKRRYGMIAIAVAAMALFADFASAKPRTDKQMRDVAIAKMLKRTAGQAAAPSATQAVKEITRDEGYVIFGKDGGGFVVVSTDDMAPEVLGYSDARISSTISNENFKWWLQAVNGVVKAAAKSNTPILRVTKPDASRYDVAVDALCSSRWGQEEPYWNQCPMGTAGRCLTGCVATSTAQVLYYHKGPKTGVGTRTIYYPANNTCGTPVTADFGNDEFDWDNMIDVYTPGNYTSQQADAVALLMKDCGVSTNMSYSPEGSGAYHDQTAEGLRKYFGLTDAKYVWRKDYSEKEWMELMYDQITKRQPVIYGGDDWSGGHSFVLDGYDSDGLVHINWGWEGEDDGYYDIALLNPSGYQFSRNQDAIINITPEPAKEMISDTVKVNAPGTLRSVLNGEMIFQYDTLRIEGKINGTDLKTLRTMAGRDEFGEKTEGGLRTLDLTAATIVSGGDAYLNEAGKGLLIDKESIVPKKAFYGCSLRTLLLPDGIKSIGSGAFAYCSRLDSVRLVPAKDADFLMKDNILYSTDGKTVVGSLPRIADKLNITGDVTKIGAYAFSSRNRIKKIIFGSQLESIAEGAFADCGSVSEIRVVSKTPVAITGAGAFDGINKTSCSLYVRAGSTAKFKSASQWGDFKNIVEYGTTVKARNSMRKYGDENPKMGYTINGDFVEGVPEVTCDATPTSPAGRYTIHISRGTITDEAVEFEDGFLIVKQAPLTVGVEDATRPEGEENPTFSLTFDGFKNNETAADAFTVMPVATCEADVYSPVGIYPISVSGGEAANYELTYTSGNLTVTKSTTGISAIGGDNGSDTFNVYSVSGKLILKDVCGFETLPKGMYIIESRDGGKAVCHKITVK